MQGSKLAALKFWYSENSGPVSIVAVAILISCFFLAGGLSKTMSEVSGVAEAQVFDNDQTGNQPKLAVKLQDGSLAYVSVSSVGAVKVGSTVCLIKSTSYLGSVSFKLGAVGKCI